MTKEQPSSGFGSGSGSHVKSRGNTIEDVIVTKTSRSNTVRLRAISRIAGGLVVISVPLGLWWWWSKKERHKVLEDVRTRVRVPNVQTTDDLLIEKCQPGDVILFDRRCEKCASGPWAALSCYAAKSFLCTGDGAKRSMMKTAEGNFDHIGLVVPGYVKSAQDMYDPSNLLLLETTSGSGIVARSLKSRLECTTSRSVVLLQLSCPGEKRNVDDDYEQTESVRRTRKHVERQLRMFRDKWVELSHKKGYKWIHSTVGIGGALSYGMGMHDYVVRNGPVSPSAYFVLMGLQYAAAAQNIAEKENLSIKVEDYLRDDRWQEQDVVHLRPGWRFLSPIYLRETSKS